MTLRKCLGMQKVPMKVLYFQNPNIPKILIGKFLVIYEELPEIWKKILRNFLGRYEESLRKFLR